MLKLEILLKAIDQISVPMDRIRSKVQAVAFPVARLAMEMEKVRMAAEQFTRTAGLDILGATIRDAGGATVRLASGFGRVGSEVSRLTSQMTRFGLVAGTALGGLAYLFNRSIIAPNAELERSMQRMQTNLGGFAAGSRAAAYGDQARLFADRHGLSELDTLRGFAAGSGVGINPERLAGAGRNAAAGMQSTLEDTMGAMRNLVRGDAGGAAALGMEAERVGNQMHLRWEQFNREYRMVIDLSNRTRATDRVAEAVQRRHGGAADRRADTWDGMADRMRAAWSNFTLAIGRSGVFDWLQDKLRDAVRWVEEMTKNGTLARWAQQTAKWIVQAFEAVQRFLFGYDEIINKDGDIVRHIGLWERLQRIFGGGGLSLDPSPWQQVTDAFSAIARYLEPIVGRIGPLKAALITIAAISLAPLAKAIATMVPAGLALIGAIIKIGAALLLTPFGWFAIGVAAVMVAAYKIWESWRGIGPFFEDLGAAALVFWEAFTAPAVRAWEAIKPIVDGVKWLLDNIDRVVAPPGINHGPDRDPDNLNPRRGGGLNRRQYGPDLGGSFGPSVNLAGYGGAGGANGRIDAGGRIDIRLTDERTLFSAKPNDGRVQYDMSQGPTMAYV